MVYGMFTTYMTNDTTAMPMSCHNDALLLNCGTSLAKLAISAVSIISGIAIRLGMLRRLIKLPCHFRLCTPC